VTISGRRLLHTLEHTYGVSRVGLIELTRVLKLCKLRGYARELQIKTIMAETD
jgi:hypothetical protein